jgi:hypothetical protein
MIQAYILSRRRLIEGEASLSSAGDAPRAVVEIDKIG